MQVGHWLDCDNITLAAAAASASGVGEQPRRRHARISALCAADAPNATQPTEGGCAHLAAALWKLTEDASKGR